MRIVLEILFVRLMDNADISPEAMQLVFDEKIGINKGGLADALG